MKFNEEEKNLQRWAYWMMGVMLILIFIVYLSNRSARIVEIGIVRYENFQEIYNVCNKLNTDLCNIKDVPETDRMFEQFTKAQRVLQIKTNLNRWIEEYNAKSKMWNHDVWKSKELPYQLNFNNFTCIN